MLELDRELARLREDAAAGRRRGGAARRLDLRHEAGRRPSWPSSTDGSRAIAIFYEGINSFRARPFLFLEDLVVTEAARGRGVGEALMAAVAREAVARGAVRLEWSVLDWNEGALRFYERLGGPPPAPSGCATAWRARRSRGWRRSRARRRAE